MALGRGQVGGGFLGAWRVFPHACTCMCMHTHTHTHVYMYRNCKWLPMWRHPCLACLACLTCMCVYAWDTPPHNHTHLHPHPPVHHPPGGHPQNQLKFDNTWTNQDISILFEDLKSVKNFPPMGGCMVWWVVGWVDGWGQVKTLKILKMLTESR